LCVGRQFDNKPATTSKVQQSFLAGSASWVRYHWCHSTSCFL